MLRAISRISVPAILCLILLASCGKELSVEQGDPLSGGTDSTGNTTGSQGKGLLDSITSSINTGEKLVARFSFDASGRLLKMTSLDYTATPQLLESVEFTRAADGKVTRFVLVNESGTATGTFEYDATGRIVKMQTVEDLAGASMSANVTLRYNGNTLASKTTLYAATSDITDVEYRDSTSYKFSGANLTHADYFYSDDITEALALASNNEFSYDSKKTPFSYNVESFLLGVAPSMSANNPTKLITKVFDPSIPTVTFTTSFSSYQADGRPLKASNKYLGLPGFEDIVASASYHYKP